MFPYAWQFHYAMGAAGTTGRKITEALLKPGEKVRASALAQSESKLGHLKRAGAELLVGDTNDAAFLTTVFHEADAAYALLSTDPQAAHYRAEHPL